jgi:hypothetical protein
MLLEMKHGGHTLPKSSADQRGAEEIDSMTPFRYLVDTIGEDGLLLVGEDTVNALDELGNAMVDPVNQDQNPDSKIPTVYTYWAQFIDHELTARTDRDANISDISLDAASLKPAKRTDVETGLLNRRTPAIELDAVYGDGPPGRHGDKIRNANSQRVDLAARLRDGAKMRVGNANVGNRALRPDTPPPTTPDPTIGLPVGPVPPPENDLNRDLPRIGALLDLGVVTLDDLPDEVKNSGTFRQRAFIGDPRNDENLVVAQFHVAMLRFHNAVVDWLRFKDPQQVQRDTDKLFEDSRRIVRWTFQWLVVNDFIKTLLDPDVAGKVLTDRAELYRKRLAAPKGQPKGGDEPYMPLEFSVACYRFGHSMIRDIYDYNRNFGRNTDGLKGFVAVNATLRNFFQFTGKNETPFLGGQVLPHNWIIEWDRFDGTSPHDQTTLPNPADPAKPTIQAARVTRKIDTRLAPTLGVLTNEGNLPAPPPEPGKEKDINALLKHLARRNLRRGYQLSLPTGQALAKAVGLTPLTSEELLRNNHENVTAALNKADLLNRTPLWYYILKEAEVQRDGEGLGQLGSRIVAETLIGVLLADPESYLSVAPDWNPSKPVPKTGGPLKLKDGRTIGKIGDLFEFAGVKPPKA